MVIRQTRPEAEFQETPVSSSSVRRLGLPPVVSRPKQRSFEATILSLDALMDLEALDSEDVSRWKSIV